MSPLNAVPLDLHSVLDFPATISSTLTIAQFLSRCSRFDIKVAIAKVNTLNTLHCKFCR